MMVGNREQQRVASPREQAGDYLWSSPAPDQRRAMPGAVVFLLAVAMIGAVGMLYLLQTNHVANLGYEMSELQAEREAALVEQQELSAQIAERQALTSVEATARFELGMRPVDDHIYLDVELPPPDGRSFAQPEIAEEPSTLERFWNRLTGSSGSAKGAPGDD